MRLRAHFIFSLVFLPLIISLGACSEQETTALPGATTSSSGETHLFRKNMIIALPPRVNIFEQTKMYQPLEEYLTETLKIDVKFKVVESYGAVIKELEQKRVEGAFLGSLTYLLARDRAGIEVIARPQRLDGSSTYTGLIFTRKNNRITKEVETWKGKTLATVHKATTAGYLYPQWYLLKAGVRNWGTVFNRIIMVGSHDAAIFMVLNGEADLGAAKNTVFKQLAKKNPLVEQSLVILSESPEVPSNALVLRKDVSPILKKEIKEALLRMDSSPSGRERLKAFEALRFVETMDRDYEPVRSMFRDLQEGSNNPLFTPF